MKTPEDKKNIIKHDIKDIVFHEAFAAKENLPEIYKSLHPDDPNEYLPDDFKIISITTDLTNNVRNDLSFWNLKTNVMTFLIADSLWKESHLVKYRKNIIITISELIKKYPDDYVSYLNNEVFVFATNPNDHPKNSYRMFEAIDKAYEDGKDIANMNTSIFSRYHKNIPENTIIDTCFQYFEKQKKIMKKFDRTKEAARILIEECIQDDIFADYFDKHKEEVITNVEAIFNQARETEAFGKERYQAGLKKGKEEKSAEVYKNALKYNIPDDIARKISGLLD